MPLPGTEVRLVRDLVEVRSPMLMSGYLGEPESAPGDGFFATNDRAFFDEHGVSAEDRPLLVTAFWGVLGQFARTYAFGEWRGAAVDYAPRIEALVFKMSKP